MYGNRLLNYETTLSSDYITQRSNFSFSPHSSPESVCPSVRRMTDVVSFLFLTNVINERFCVGHR